MCLDKWGAVHRAAIRSFLFLRYFSKITFIIIVLLFVGGCDRGGKFAYKSFTHSRIKECAVFSLIPEKTIKCNTFILPGNNVLISFTVGDGLKNSISKILLYRSTMDLSKVRTDFNSYIPLVRFSLKSNAESFIDTTTADNTTYYYILEIMDMSGLTHRSPVLSVKTRKVSVSGKIKSPVFFVDKLYYYLEVRDGDKRVKRYPVVLGRDPVRRKLHQDNSTTPEGMYKIINTQSNATYYKAYDINYPNDADKVRYGIAKENSFLPRKKVTGEIPSIGGEIQIHGSESLNWNWTFGCIALRNADMDELFSCPEICIGVPVIIAGSEIKPEDIESIKKYRHGQKLIWLCKKLSRLGYNTGFSGNEMNDKILRAFGLFQLDRNLPLTCEPDKATVKLLEKVEND